MHFSADVKMGAVIIENTLQVDIAQLAERLNLIRTFSQTWKESYNGKDPRLLGTIHRGLRNIA